MRFKNQTIKDIIAYNCLFFICFLLLTIIMGIIYSAKEYQNAVGLIYDLSDKYLSNLNRFGSFISLDENSILLNYIISLVVISTIAGIVSHLLIEKIKK